VTYAVDDPFSVTPVSTGCAGHRPGCRRRGVPVLGVGVGGEVEGVTAASPLRMLQSRVAEFSSAGSMGEVARPAARARCARTRPPSRWPIVGPGAGRRVGAVEQPDGPARLLCTVGLKLLPFTPPGAVACSLASYNMWG
jgi:hypothetical protein